jgi:arginine decarboxylase
LTNLSFKLSTSFFVDTGIKDTIYYWGEFKKVLKTYCELKKICPDLRAIDIGGGLPIPTALALNMIIVI